MGTTTAWKRSLSERWENTHVFPTMMDMCESDNWCSRSFTATATQLQRCYRSQSAWTWRHPSPGSYNVTWIRTKIRHKPATASTFPAVSAGPWLEFPKRLRRSVSTRNDCQIYQQRNEMYTIGAILRMSGRHREGEATHWGGGVDLKKRTYLFT